MLCLWTCIGDQICDSNEWLRLKVQFHVCSVLLEGVQNLLGRSAEDVMNLMDLIELIVAWKQWK